MLKVGDKGREDVKKELVAELRENGKNGGRIWPSADIKIGHKPHCKQVYQWTGSGMASSHCKSD